MKAKRHLYNEKTQQPVRELRQQPTQAEKRLWLELRKLHLSHQIRFRRQHPLDRFIVDFYFERTRLIIEVDGLSHDMETQKDALRDASFITQGYQVLRFTDEQVMQNCEGVILNILEHCQPPHPTSPPASHGERSKS